MKSQRGVVAAGHRLTADAAAEILEEGGNAYDAAVAGMAMAFVAEAVLASPGGSGFLMARSAGRGRTRLYDFFAETPLRKSGAKDVSGFFPIHADFGPARQEFHIGLASSAAPGAVPGLFAIHADLCRLPVKRLLEPAIRAARGGFPVTSFQAYLFAVIEPILIASPGIARIFAPEGRLLKEGDTFRNCDLAETLAWLGEDGARLFRDGDVGRAIVEQAETGGGLLSEADLAAYRVERREPLLWQHRGASIALNPPPAASGALIAVGLAYLEALAARGRKLDTAAIREALQAANDARAKHGDALAAQLGGDLLARALQSAAAHSAAPRGTTHLSVIDAEGHAAAISLSNGEGNGFAVGNFGFMLNNMLGEEDLVPNGFGTWRSGVRLSSMMAPTIIASPDGSVIALGTGGSNRIRSAILQVVVNLIDRGMEVEPAVCAPRLHVEKCGMVSFEPGLDGGEALLEVGGKVQAWPAPNLFFGGVHSARRHANGSFEGAGDPRRGGVSLVA
jgi:gamma-glutamyltranspeptidase/glutathione hydrolase